MIDLLGFWFNVSLATIIPLAFIALVLTEPLWHLLRKASEGRYDCKPLRDFHDWFYMVEEYYRERYFFNSGYENKWDSHADRALMFILGIASSCLMIVAVIVHNIVHLAGDTVMWGVQYDSASAMTVGWVSTIAEVLAPFTGWVALFLLSTIGVYGLLKLGFRMYYSVADKLAALEK